jgi:hypothetical protein
MFSMAGNTPDRTLSVIYATGDTATVPESHDRFEDLVDLLLSGAGDEEVSELVDVMLAVTKHLAQLSERVSIRGRTVLFDGDPLRGELADVLFELFEAGNSEALRPVVNFLEKASTNPSSRSVDELYRWITKGSMIIHEDGDFLAYKGVQVLGDDSLVSFTSGTAFVNGEEITGPIPNPIGGVVTMPRSSVDDNMHEACSTGLHAGTYEYATKFLGWHQQSGCLVLVKINPRDVVSVPTDDLDQKLRVCRYVVQEIIASRRESRVFYEQPQPVDETEDQSPTGTVQLDVVPDFEVVAFGFYEEGDELPEGGLLILPEGLSPDGSTEEERLASDEALETLRQKLITWKDEQEAPSEAEVEAAAAEKVVRDSKGRFTSESAVKAVRNAKGQFTKRS